LEYNNLISAALDETIPQLQNLLRRLQGDLQEQESIGIYFSVGCSVFFLFFFHFLYQFFWAKFNPQKKKKKVKFTLEEKIIKFSQFLCQKDSEISPEKKTTQFHYLA